MEQPNLSYINNLAAGDEVFKSKLITVVKNELPGEIETYHSNMNSSAFAKAAENVHKLKHKLGILGLVDGYEMAIAYEDELKEGKTTLKTEFESILVACNHFINDL